jgi:hypothetical protein
MSIIKIMLNHLRKKYLFLKLEAGNIYPYHPTRYAIPEVFGNFPLNLGSFG